jgi:hypothetical protein
MTRRLRLLAFAALVVLAVGCRDDYGSSSNDASPSGPHYSDTIKAFAGLEAGTTDPDDATLREAQQVADAVVKVCPEYSADDAADSATAIVEQVEKRGRKIGYFEAARSLAASVPDDAVGTVKCDEVAAGFIVTYTS